MKIETFKRVKADFPLIYFATTAGALTQYLISLPEGQAVDWLIVLKIFAITFVALGLVFLVYWAIFHQKNPRVKWDDL